MLQGTGSDVGKSLVVAGLCRAFTARGLRVRPFKPQNMSNNAAVTADGGEIGRAQALQARACGIAPTSDMNPVLLKPETDTGAQVIVQGRRWRSAKAREYQSLKRELLPLALQSFERVSCDADLVLVEGAGSPAEVNLRRGDIANMGFAEAADLPVVLIGDIDRGGVIAQLVGTWTVLAPADRARLKGCIINKFRGDPRLFDGGLAEIGKRTGLPCFGLVPYLDAARRLPAEDAVALERDEPTERRSIRVAVPVLSRMANFDDLDPLRAEPDVQVIFVRAGEAIPGDADLVVLCGSKSTLGDLAYLCAQGWDVDIKAHVRRGGMVLGLCAGYQMLGTRIADPSGLEGPAGAADGLGLLDVATELAPTKRLAEVRGSDAMHGHAVRGYEMHLGVTTGPGLARPMLTLGGRPDGAVSGNGRVMGCYLHGLFASDDFRHGFLARLKPRLRGALDYDASVEAALDDLARHLEAHLDLDALLAVARRDDVAAAETSVR
ncbi:MAG TPA: cobyric acid synthase [Stellaceae bacterium]|nr:cobyric acid synthase [Stellaceae bacterium]